MERWTKGALVNSGKTKEIFTAVEDPTMGIVKTGNNITAHDDPNFTKQFEAKPRLATMTTCNVLRLLQACGLPVAFKEQLGEDEFLVPIVEMIPLEAVCRRVADGSYLKRCPEFKRPGKLHQFHSLKTELFLKTTGGKLAKGERVLVSDLPMIKVKEGEKPLDDPFIVNPDSDEEWQLFDPKKPAWAEGADLQKTAPAPDVVFPTKVTISPEWTVKKILARIDYLNRWAFLVIERAWGILGYKLGDWKIEFGWTKDGELVIADVIDNDSWRLKDAEDKELSKQVFRDHGLIKEVEINYALISEMSKRFRLPKQAIVLWRGSPDDKLPEVPEIPGVIKVEITNSGHKATMASLQKLEETIRDFPEGGVIICNVGMSNGLGPILASHTSWVVISVPATFKEFPDDVYSSLRLPSKVAMATVPSDKNAVLLALNVLALSNPAVYAFRQLEIEGLDPSY